MLGSIPVKGRRSTRVRGVIIEYELTGVSVKDFIEATPPLHLPELLLAVCGCTERLGSDNIRQEKAVWDEYVRWASKVCKTFQEPHGDLYDWAVVSEESNNPPAVDLPIIDVLINPSRTSDQYHFRMRLVRE